MNRLVILLGLALCLYACGGDSPAENRGKAGRDADYLAPAVIETYRDGLPYTRWWWHAMKFSREDIREQLIWLRDQGFGGVEISFIYPVNRDPDGERFEWLGEEWQQMVVYAKHCADSLGMGCDFTYGTLWPFGGTFVSDDDRTRVWIDSAYRQPLRLSWTHPDTGNVVNHMSREAFLRYAEVMSEAFRPAMAGGQSALFCDSWEVRTDYIWTPGFENIFAERFGYDIQPYMPDIYAPENAGPRYDYMKLVADLVLHEFFIPFHQESRALGGLSRAQAMGSPTDLIRAYSVLDIPETEAMLYEPNFSNIVASAAALSGKPLVSSESFTCLYGWPAEYMFYEQTADLKLVADALFANGVNLHIWHGTPFNPVGVDTIYFYASVHVGTRGSLHPDLRAFNDYLTRVSQAMRRGRTHADVAVYLPLEDAWMAGVLPEELQMPWSWGAYELRYEYFPSELKGFRPLWINTHFLKQARVNDGRMHVGDMSFEALFVEAQHLDTESLEAMLALARQGLPLYFSTLPVRAGHLPEPGFEKGLKALFALPNVYKGFEKLHGLKPLFEGEQIPEFWARSHGDSLSVFLANPLAGGLRYPLSYGQSYQEKPIALNLTLNYRQHRLPLHLVFEPYQSLLLQLAPDGSWKLEDIGYMPPAAVTTPPSPERK